MMKHTLPGQLDLPRLPEDLTHLARRPMLPAKEQKPCDIGLFSDAANQLDLIEMFMD
jgi:hypothetical protein